jgi:hypothetical protein
VQRQDREIFYRNILHNAHSAAAEQRLIVSKAGHTEISTVHKKDRQTGVLTAQTRQTDLAIFHIAQTEHMYRVSTSLGTGQTRLFHSAEIGHSSLELLQVRCQSKGQQTERGIPGQVTDDTDRNDLTLDFSMELIRIPWNLWIFPITLAHSENSTNCSNRIKEYQYGEIACQNFRSNIQIHSIRDHNYWWVLLVA